MQIDELKPEYKQIIREVVVEIFKEVADKKVFGVDKQVLMLDEHLADIVANRLSNYKVNVYGAELQER